MSDNYSTGTVTEAIFILTLGQFFKTIKKFDHKSVLGVFGYVEYDATKIIIT